MSTPIRISRVSLRQVEVPLRQIYVSAMYLTATASRILVEVEASDGSVGYGETHGGMDTFEAAIRQARILLNRDPLDRLALRRSLAGPVVASRNGRRDWAAFGGLELALWDWAGRKLGLPLWRLLGGSSAREIELVCPVPALILSRPVDRADLPRLYRDAGRIADVVDYCRARMREDGFDAFKYKSTGVSAEWDVAVLRALRRELGAGVRLRWDPNAAYPLTTALDIAEAVEELGLEFLEDPTAGIGAMAQLRTGVRTPVATNMCVAQFDHLQATGHRPCADVLLLDVSMWGGVHGVLEAAEAAPLLGFEVAIHSFFETGVGTAANLHLASALPSIARATDFGLHNVASELATPHLLPVRGGRLRPTDGPGLGVVTALDEVAPHVVATSIVT